MYPWARHKGVVGPRSWGRESLGGTGKGVGGGRGLLVEVAGEPELCR
jgi:hypothetical protein